MVRQVRSDFLWRNHWGVTSEHLALTSNEELVEVPENVGIAVVVSLFALQIGEQRSFVFTVDLDLGEHRERDVKFRRRKLKNLSVGAWFLLPKLVAGETKNGESVVFVVFMKRTQTCVLRGKTSSAGDVDNQANLILKLLELDLIARDGRHR